MIPLFRCFMDPGIPAAIAEIIKPKPNGSVYVGEGVQCAELERELEETLTLPRRPVLVNSGTSAIKIALRLAGARPGAEVIASPVTCLLANEAILDTGARIVWADVDPLTGNLDPIDAARKVTSRTVAILATDWAGRLCDFAALRALTRGVTIIEDAAHAFGVPRQAGPSWGGDFVCWSAQAIKHWSMVDGGVVLCPGTAATEDAKRVRWAGLDRTRSDSMRCYQSVSTWGYKAQSNDIAATIGRCNIAGALARVTEHMKNANTLRAALASCGNVRLAPARMSAAWIFPVLVSWPIEFEGFMSAHGVEVSQVHARNDAQPCFDAWADRVPLPGVDSFMAHQSNLPCGWWLTDELEARIIPAVRAWNEQPSARW